MKFRFCAVLFFTGAVLGFGQSALLRDYVGLINQTFHPDIVAYMNKFKTEFGRDGDDDAAKGIDAFLKGGSGSGFIYVDTAGNNYILTNHHVITQSYTLSVTFEKQDGTKTKYEGLSILAADEDMDIALLAFPAGVRPFKQGLAFLNRAVDEGEDVYSAGFPGLGGISLWQFGRGMVSNASVRFPVGEDTDRMMGPYIQHTAQVDPGNSGGPLLVPQEGAPAGYAVAGINTLSARFRQAANYAIPLSRVQEFINAALSTETVNEWERLDKRLASFMEGLGDSKAVYTHIARYLSRDCIAQNADFAMSEVLARAPLPVEEEITNAFNYYPVDGMHYAVAWVIENKLRSKNSAISIQMEETVAQAKNEYAVVFSINGERVKTEWINEYGNWKLNTFEGIRKRPETVRPATSSRNKKEGNADFKHGMISGGYTHIIDLGPAVYLDFSVPLDYVLLSLHAVYGFKGVDKTLLWFPIPPDPDYYLRVEMMAGWHYTFDLNKVGLMPFAQAGIGYDTTATVLHIGLSVRAGCTVTFKDLKGLFASSSYQFNLLNRQLVSVGIGYGF
ncbi:MAG: serine protease [Treponema sp.]|jgi:serine protease Do|nr:serine protease [Treponema sp.]